MADIKTTWESIYDLSLQLSNKKLERMNKEKELSGTELYREIQELKKEENDMNDLIETRKKFVKDSMLSAWLKSMEFEHQKVTLKKSPGKVVVKEEQHIPDIYKKEKITITLDKKKIKEWLVAWDIIPWAKIEIWYSLLITPRD